MKRVEPGLKLPQAVGSACRQSGRAIEDCYTLNPKATKAAISRFKLLDKDDPSKVIGRTPEPLLAAKDQDREGYVPNVVYSCGAIRHGDKLFLPYGIADSSVGFGGLSASKTGWTFATSCSPCRTGVACWAAVPVRAADTVRARWKPWSRAPRVPSAPNSVAR